MTTPHILIIDDEPDIRELLEITLSRMGMTTHSAESVSTARKALTETAFDLCLTDMNLPDGDGLEIINHIQQNNLAVPVAMITAYGSVDLAIKALKAGAFDFVSKPIELPQLRNLVESAVKLKQTQSNNNDNQTVQLLGETPELKSLREQIAKLSRSQAPVFISGESGSGKEIVARLIHNNGPRCNAPFIPVNCGAIPTELMESEFFGHVKGSFTGAFEDKQGLFQAAEGGTLFLDEVADLPLSMQVKLLRAIQEKSIRRVGASDEITTNVRLLSATHKDLNSEVNAQRFRQDLYYRINVIEIKVPSLRERAADILLLAGHTLDKLSKEWGQEKPSLSGPAKTALQNYSFPGNVRELENILQRAYTLCENNQIDVADLQLNSDTQNTNTLYQSTDASQAFGSLDVYMESVEKDAISQALEQTRWNKTAAAELLGISFRQLRYRLKKLGLDKE